MTKPAPYTRHSQWCKSRSLVERHHNQHFFLVLCGIFKMQRQLLSAVKTQILREAITHMKITKSHFRCSSDEQLVGNQCLTVPHHVPRSLIVPMFLRLHWVCILCFFSVRAKFSEVNCSNRSLCCPSWIVSYVTAHFCETYTPSPTGEWTYSEFINWKSSQSE